MNIGNRFKHYRLRKKLSQKEASELIGVKSYQLANYETGRSEPSIKVLKNMSHFYGASIDQLVGNNRLCKMSEQEKELFEAERKEFAEKLEEALKILQEVYDNK